MSMEHARALCGRKGASAHRAAYQHASCNRRQAASGCHAVLACIPSPLGRSFRPRPSRALLLLLQIYIGQELLSYFFESVPTPRLRCTRHVVGCLRCAVQRCRARVACRTVPARGVRRRRPRFTAVRTHLIRIPPVGPLLAPAPARRQMRPVRIGRQRLAAADGTAQHGSCN